MTWRRIYLVALFGVITLAGGCMTSNDPSFGDLSEGVPADPATYELVVKDCTANVGSHIDYELELTNLDDKSRAFMTEVFVRDINGEFRNATRGIHPWVKSGETQRIKAWVGWDDAYDTDTACDFKILRSTLEAG